MADKKANPHRVTCSFACFVVGIGTPIVFFLFFRSAMFYGVPDGAWNFNRYIWCCCMGLIGFGGLAWYYHTEERAPYLQYLTWHVPQLLATAALIFGGLHLFPASSGHVFYYLSAGLCVPLGFLAEEYLSLFKALVKKMSKE
jgi:hypothetical protein